MLIDINPVTETVISCAIEVSNTLGVGYLEKVYENALAHELNKRGVGARQQHPVKVSYDGTIVGDYVVDLLVDSAIIVELKAAKGIDSIHEAQLLNYIEGNWAEGWSDSELRYPQTRHQTPPPLGASVFIRGFSSPKGRWRDLLLSRAGGRGRALRTR